MPPTAAVVAGPEPEMAEKEHAREYGDVGEAAPDVSHQAVGHRDQPLADAAFFHERARQEEHGHGDEWKFIQPVVVGEGETLQRQVRQPIGEDRRGAEGDADGYAQRQEYGQRTEQDEGYIHTSSSSFSVW